MNQKHYCNKSNKEFKKTVHIKKLGKNGLSHANQKGSLENVDIVYRALISLLNNFNALTEMFLKSHNEIKHKYFLVAGMFTPRLFRKKVQQGRKEKKKSCQN